MNSNFFNTKPDSQNKAQFVGDLFGSIAKTYDIANDVMTFGLARIWRKKLVSLSNVKKGQNVLDCATGTGDLAFLFKNAVGQSGSVIGCDFCKEMISLADKKNHQLNKNVQFEWADIMNLKYQNQEFDIVSVAYGIRNVSNVNIGLKELARVTKSDGVVMILETGSPSKTWFGRLLNFYFKLIVPLIGGLISGKRSAYQYLNESSIGFPAGNNFTALMKTTGDFKQIEFYSLMGGASYIYKGIVR